MKQPVAAGGAPLKPCGTNCVARSDNGCSEQLQGHQLVAFVSVQTHIASMHCTLSQHTSLRLEHMLCQQRVDQLRICDRCWVSSLQWAARISSVNVHTHMMSSSVLEPCAAVVV